MNWLSLMKLSVDMLFSLKYASSANIRLSWICSAPAGSAEKSITSQAFTTSLSRNRPEETSEAPVPAPANSTGVVIGVPPFATAAASVCPGQKKTSRSSRQFRLTMKGDTAPTPISVSRIVLPRWP